MRYTVQMSGEGEEPMATAAEVAQRLGVPRYAVYRMAEAGRIPGYPQPRQPWHSPNRKRWLFRLSEVEAAYAKLAADAGQPPAD
jgi:excisionase family DNA binding protein